MKKFNKTLAVALCAALAVGSVQAPAEAKMQQMPGGVLVTHTPEGEGFAKVDVAHGTTTEFDFENPQSIAGLLTGKIRTALSVDGVPVEFLPTRTISSTSENEVGEVVTLSHIDDLQMIKVIRTMVIGVNSIDFEVEAINMAPFERAINIEVATDFPSYQGQPGRVDKDGVFVVGPEELGYDLRVFFEQPRVSGAAASAEKAARAATVGAVDEQGAGFQFGRWLQSVPGSGSLKAAMSLQIETQPTAKDGDRDGLPDEWERKGFTTKSGVSFPLNKWGADPNKPDLFLQLNWQKSEWETLECSKSESFDANVEDFTKFAGCATSNANVYRPSRDSLEALVDLFADHGINLHIDAGDLFANIDNYDQRYGGPTEDYERFYFPEGTSAREKLNQKRRALLGERDAVFRVGIIGDQMAQDDWSTGLGLVNDSVFYVSNHENVTNHDQLRNTILHEFGHNLGLTHTGAKQTNPVETEEYLPNYRSVMNYLYQWSIFNYSEKESRSGGVLPPECEKENVKCYAGEYAVPRDWDHLNFKGKFIGSVEGTTGTEDQEKPEARHDVTARELEIIAADQNAGMAGFRIFGGEDAAIVTNRNDNVVYGEVRNLGLDLHDFTVYATYPSVNAAQPVVVRVPGQLNSSKEEPSAKVAIPIRNAASLTGATMPLTISVENAKGEKVFEEKYGISVLDYTVDEMERVLDEVKKDPNASKDLLDFAERNLNPAAGREAPEQPDEIETRPNDGLTGGTGPDGEAGSSDNVGLIVGIIAAVGGVLAALYAAAWSSGLIKL